MVRKAAEVKRCAPVIQVPTVTNIQTDLHILPSSSKVGSFAGKNSKAAPAVKVLKVVKTAAQSKQEIDNELLQALDDRNKKNAVQAKLNREKKKVYIKGLEDEIEELKCENFTLKERNQTVTNEKNELQEEVEYLRSVLANQSALSGLLKNIGNVENVKLTSSLRRKRGADLDHDYHNSAKFAKKSGKKTAGICLHVDQGSVSLEFCSKCASMAKSGEKEGNP
jgi:FtsZ-binding cell division protein ZapB